MPDENSQAKPIDEQTNPQQNWSRSLFDTSNLVVALLLVLTLLVGAYYRFTGLNWDDFTHLHPDERFLTQVVSALGNNLNPDDPDYITCQERYPQDGRGLYLNGGYFDATCSALNPNNLGFGLYVYGTLPLFIADVGSDRYGDLRQWWDTRQALSNGEAPPPAYEFDLWSGYNGAHLVWRALNGASDLLATFFLFLIGRRLYNKWTGLLAAVLYVASPLAIQKAHFATVNSMANLFGVLTFYFAVRILDGGRLRDYFAFGIAFAAALASRINLAPLVVLALLAAGVRMLPMLDAKLAWGERGRIFNREFGGLVVAGTVTIVMFRIFQPYAFIGPGLFPVNIGILMDELFVQNEVHTLGVFNQEWLDNIGQAQYLVSGEAESPPNWQWVNRTGYVFPLTNMLLWGMGLALGLAAWLGWLWGGVRLVRGQDRSLRHLLPVVWILVYFAWIGNLWVMSMRYYLPLYPALTLMGAWALVHLWQQTSNGSRGGLRRMLSVGLVVLVVGFTHVWALMFTNIYRNQLTRVQATNWVWENVPGDFALPIAGAPDAPLINIAIFNPPGSENNLGTQASILDASNDYPFTVTADGTLDRVIIPHLGSPQQQGETNLRLDVLDNSGGLISSGTLSGTFTRDRHIIGDRYELLLDPPLAVQANETYTLRATTDQPLYISGAVVSHEGSWDDPVPTVACTPPPGVTVADQTPPGQLSARECNGRNAYGALVNGYSLYIALDDIALKRDAMQLALNNSDYVVISSNRFYDSISRNPARWPMTRAYYDALFGGELGFELAATFQETFELGPLRVSDQYLPTMDAPAWLNEFEAEEAFHVYDHPVVFIFRKTDAYDATQVAVLLDSVELSRADDIAIGSFNDPSLVGVMPTYSLPADETPTQLKLKPQDRELQYENGTWSRLFFSESPINTWPILTVIVWWLTIMLVGAATFPLTFALFPALADRGYATAKITGLFLVAWFAWMATSLNLRLWSRGGLWFTLLLLVVLSGYFAYKHRSDLRLYLRQYWPRLVAIEVITVAAFLFFLGVRLMNPDLWHFAFGGEKPMDFAYFNAVLRSTTFPPLDPWHAGGYINYYYFGFVLVGVPVLMLGVVPAVAYNLIIPTLFALTGIGAFAVAFNIVAWLRPTADDLHAETATPRRLRGNPWVAGIMALLMAVLLGNLGTPSVFVDGLARSGGALQAATNITDYLFLEFEQENGRAPAGEEVTPLMQQATNPTPALEREFARYQREQNIDSLLIGFQRWADGQALNLPTNRWYWGPTRILAEPPVSSGNAITEIPYFTFLYGDLHAHMISMPLQFFLMLFLMHEVIQTRRDSKRSTFATVLTIGIGAAMTGMLRATNTWDWPTYMLLCVAGLGFAWWLKWRGFSRASLVDVFLRVGGFITLSVWLSYPYTRWYAAIYSSASPWAGPKTPVWAYLTIHGLFLFLITSLLIWQTARWMQTTYVRDLRGRANWLYAGVGGLLTVLLVSLGLSLYEWNVTIVALPLMIWAAALFFLPQQTRAMQFVLVLAIVALGATLGVEYIVIDGDIGRQNTVFKFYLQAWLMFSVVGGVAIAWLLEDSSEWNLGTRAGWSMSLGVLVAVAALYPLTATQARAIDRFTPTAGATLDGMAYMQTAVHYEVTNSAMGEGSNLELVHDYRLIRWLQENLQGTPVIMEGQSEREYLWGSRISVYTGLPAVQGWNWHQRQQRTFDPMPRMVQQRVANVNAFYSTTDPRVKADILQHYEVEYVMVGVLERARYPEIGLDTLTELADADVLSVVYEDEVNIVYSVDLDAAAAYALQATELASS